jgi:hypothetical protein
VLNTHCALFAPHQQGRPPLLNRFVCQTLLGDAGQTHRQQTHSHQIKHINSRRESHSRQLNLDQGRPPYHQMSNQSILRITRELSEIQKGSDLSLAVACRDIDIRHVRALIIGPPDTPYEFGFFEFALKFTKDYPGKAPQVTAITTWGGRTRFNPNIYAAGKVCLSILG